MEEAPVTAATGALGPVVAKLRALLRRQGEYKLRRPTRKDVKVIKSKLKSVHSILWVTWERGGVDADGKELRMEAWRLADDMNDAIDDFILSLKHSNDGKRFMEDKTQPRPFTDLKRRAVDVCERCRSKWQMETAHTTISSLFSRKRTSIDSGPAKQPRVYPYVHKDISELVGMEKPRDKLIEHLVGEEESTPELKMASILGPAGVGKTTLARLIFEEIEDMFEARAFVSTTSCHNTTEALASILQQIAGLSIPGTKEATEKHLIDTISNFLKNKRYLVIVDDIWHYGEWKTIKMSLPDNILCSRIVTTSRVISVTEKWRDDFDAFIYEIYHSDDWDESAITKMIDINADTIGEGVHVGHHIVKMCTGMPLAVACMMSALAKQGERQEQQDMIEDQVMRNGIQNTQGFEPLVESLELGYNNLPHHMLKTCLLYCSIYPEDHCFVRDDLVRRWIAEGFVCEEAAKDYFDELVSRGLIKKMRCPGEVVCYKVHPMMRNYLRQKLREDNFITCTSDGVPSSPIIGRLCIDDHWPSSDAAEQMDPCLSGIDWHHIRSLVMLKDAKPARVPYKHMQHLRVLDVQCNYFLDLCEQFQDLRVLDVQCNKQDLCEQLQHLFMWCLIDNQHLKDMCGLLRLRHLFVSGGLNHASADRITYLKEVVRNSVRNSALAFEKVITEMPAGIGRLKYLETLELRDTGITRLPAEIGDLKQLKTLDVSWNTRLTGLPREMGNLQHLERLIIPRSEIREEDWEIIGRLKKLKTLNVSYNQELSGIPKEIGVLQHLEMLDVSNNERITELPKEIGKLQHLKTLNLAQTGITELPPEIGNLQQLQILGLSSTRTITKLPRDILRLQNLEELYLSGTGVRRVPREIRGLKKLKILDADFGTLPFEAGQLSKLEGLPKCVHKAWKNSDLMSSLAGEILSFHKSYSIGDGGLILGTKHMHIPQWIKEHFNNVGFLDIRTCKVEEQDLKILREMPSLYKLKLRFEAVPRRPTVISSEGFANLFHLTVHSRVPRITFHEGAMPRLWMLKFEFKFYGSPLNTEPMGIKHLVNLSSVRFECSEWYRLDSSCISATIDVMKKETWDHPNRNRLSLSVGVQGKGSMYDVFPRPDIAESSQGSNEASSSGANEIEEIQA